MHVLATASKVLSYTSRLLVREKSDLQMITVPVAIVQAGESPIQNYGRFEA